MTLIADNCVGQNKNRTVIRYLMWLVESGHFTSTKFIFLIVGHTKNACDRSFNLLKLDYNRRDTYNYNTLHKTLKKYGDMIDRVEQMQESQFKDYDAWLDKYYKRPKTNTTARNHVFRIDGMTRGAHPTNLVTQEYRDSSREVQNLQKGRTKNLVGEAFANGIIAEDGR